MYIHGLLIYPDVNNLDQTHNCTLRALNRIAKIPRSALRKRVGT